MVLLNNMQEIFVYQEDELTMILLSRQAFSDTPTTISVKSSDIISDVQRGERVFSDGVGTISRSIVEKICEKLKRKHLSKPTCFQIRYQGMSALFPYIHHSSRYGCIRS